MTSLLPASLSQDSSVNNRRVVTFCSSGNLDGDLVLPDNTELIIRDFAYVKCGNLTLGRNSLLWIESGTLKVSESCVLSLGEGSRLDARGGTLDLTGARCNLKPGSTLMLSDYPVKGGVLAGGWATLPVSELGGDYELHRYRCYLQAPIAKVFDGTEFEGRWDMDRAYPQWFADADCDDWSGPINKAIDLKGSGEVFLPGGFYYVKSTIRVRVGIQLIGDPGVSLKHSEVDNIGGVDVTPTVIIPIQNIATTSPSEGASTLNHGFSKGIVIAVNIDSASLAWGNTYAPGEGATDEKKLENWKKRIRLLLLRMGRHGRSDIRCPVQ